MNSHAISVLEFGKVVRMIVDRASFEPGAERASRLSPIVDVATINEEQTRATELRSILDRGERLPAELQV